MLPIKETAFHKFLLDSIEKGGLTNDDVVAVIMPLLEEVYSFHSSGKVGPLNNIASLLITNEKLDIEESLIQNPSDNIGAIKKILPNNTGTFEVSGHFKQSTSIGEYSSVELKNKLFRITIKITKNIKKQVTTRSNNQKTTIRTFA